MCLKKRHLSLLELCVILLLKSFKVFRADSLLQHSLHFKSDCHVCRHITFVQETRLHSFFVFLSVVLKPLFDSLRSPQLHLYFKETLYTSHN